MKYLSLLLACSLLVGCATDYVKVPRVPAWDDVDIVYEAGDVRRFVFAEVGVFPSLSDSEYTPMSDDWVDRMLDWTWHFSHATGIAYTAESFDCDKFAKAASLAAEIAAARAGVKAQPLIARVYVMQKLPFGGVPATDGAHAVNAVLTETGIWIIEPQTRRKTELKNYPNKNHIYHVAIGG